MPEILKNRITHVSQRLANYCEECAKINSTDCINHGGPPSDFNTSILGKRFGDDAFADFQSRSRMDDKHWMKDIFKPSTKRPNASSSSFAIPSPSPKLAATNLSRPPVSLPTIAPPAPPVPHVSPAAAPSTEVATLPSGPDTSSDQSREQALPDRLEQDNDDTSCKEGGVRFRENLGKYVVEYRPPRFKWKLWMGTYPTVDEGRRACDCARFYAGQDKGGFYFKDSPTLFSELGPLNRPFTLVSKDLKDKAFNAELKKRAKLVIRKVLDAQRAKQAVDVTRPTASVPLSEAAIVRVLGANARTSISSLSVLDRLPSSTPESVAITGPAHEQLTSSSQESLAITGPAHEQLTSSSQESLAITVPAYEENAVVECSQEEVASAAVEASDPFANLAPLPASLSVPSEYSSYPVFVPCFNMVSDLQFPAAGIHPSLDYFADELEGGDYVELWNHEF